MMPFLSTFPHPTHVTIHYQRNNESGDQEADFVIAGRVASCYSFLHIEAEKSKNQFACSWNV
jgi:hypothetical protein